MITLPGDIPGLLRRGSPVFAYSDKPKVVGNISPSGIASVGPHAAVAPAAIRLDLTDATGRAHAAWWLAAKVGIASLVMWDRSAYQRIGLKPRKYWPWSHAALARLDPNDPRLLPDGSRWVDAEALRLVCLHAAGRAP